MKTLTTALALLTVTAALNAQPNYDMQGMQREKFGRGVVAVRADSATVAVSWRYLSSDPKDSAFDVYRDGKKVNAEPVAGCTLYYDTFPSCQEARYEVRSITSGREGSICNGRCTLPANAPVGYVNIPLDKPADGVTPRGDTYTYSPNDATVADVDGDGELEIILKWDPSNSRDNSQDGYTGNVLIDCYRITGGRLWRIDMGRNVRAGAHYTQMIAYDLDGDGRAELALRTCDGTTDAKGRVIGDADADWRLPADEKGKNEGRILEGREFVTVFDGLTGVALQTIDYIPQRGEPRAWGDRRANRSDRFLATVAHLDGVHPSLLMCRGYYTRTVIAAFDWNGRELTHRWTFDTDAEGNGNFAGQGNHNLRIADIDGDGRDEIVYGQMTVDDDGRGLYSTGMGHGDALHLTQFDSDDKRLQVFGCHENKRDGTTLRDAATGEILWQLPSTADVGRCLAADIDPLNRGLEMWSQHSDGIRDIHGKLLARRHRSLPINMAVWWDGDLLRELLDDTKIVKYNWRTETCDTLCEFEGTVSINGTKANPCLQGDIVGDWREEVLMPSADGTALRLYVSTLPTKYRFHTFLEDPPYRMSLAVENVGYNQPTQPGFYFGPDLKGTFRGCVIE